MLFQTSPKLLAALVAIACATAAVTGCGNADSKTPATQVAAKVNGAEISVHQINALLSKATGVTNENAPKARQEILDRLVGQQLAVEQAQAKKLDRNPDVLLNIEAARREILARAYLEQVAAANAKLTDEEIKRYYDEHPDLFAKRRIYAMQELTIAKNAGSLDGLKEFIAGGKSMDDIAGWLKNKGIAARASQGQRPAEQMPLELLPKIAQMKDGQTAMIDGPQAVMVLHLAASKNSPVDEAAAKPRIQQFLQNERNGKVIAEEMKKLKEAAKIEYVGDFAKLAAAPADTKPAAAPAAPSAPQESAAAPVAGALEKGIAGLK